MPTDIDKDMNMNIFSNWFVEFNNFMFQIITVT